VRTGSPAQTTNWLPGAGDRLQPGLNRHSPDDHTLAGDGNTA
jgi:hypothetical protein